LGPDLGPLWEREGVQKHRRHKKNHRADIPINGPPSPSPTMEKWT